MKQTILLILCCVVAESSFAQQAPLRDPKPVLSPAMEYTKQRLTEQVLKQLDKIDWNHTERTTSGGTVLYTIPVVVHVLHNYGNEVVPDNSIYQMMDKLNSLFLKTTPDTTLIIDKYKPVAASTQIAFKLATKDPDGNTTKGIEHIFSYLTYANDSFINQSKINQWPQERYMNIWTTNSLTTYSTGYSYSAVYASYYPYYDGVMILAGYLLYSPTAPRYFAKYLDLPNPCNGFGPPPSCNDNDLIPDTPPCNSNYYCSDVYDTVCDTPNTQNVMCGLDTCAIMFTYGQGQYMQNILQLEFGNRDSLITPYTFSLTGLDQPMPDMLPVADFSVGAPISGTTAPRHFYGQGLNISFKNQSWRDTITAASWSFSNNANIPSSTSLTNVLNKFHEPGWVSVSLAVTGNNTGTDTLTDDHALFIADSIATPALGYQQEFTPGPGMDKWPMFNYYKNNFAWKLGGFGYFDNSGLWYTSFDNRHFPYNMSGTPQGDVDDVFTPIFDLTGFTDSCYLNFMSSGATRTANTRFMRDSIEIDYSTNNTVSWSKLTLLKGGLLYNKGTVSDFYLPSSMSDWIAHSISLPVAARTAHTVFRFRYFPGADSTGMSTGNNFFMDNFNFNGVPEEVKNIDQYPTGVVLLPNPTHGNAYVIIKDKTTFTDAAVTVTDVTGKVVYYTKQSNYTSSDRIEIPAWAIATKGLYLVHVVTGGMNQTEKLVVY